MNLPRNPVLLLSFINTELRDNYADLNHLCEDLDISRSEIEFALNKIEYFYNDNSNQFKLAE